MFKLHLTKHLYSRQTVTFDGETRSVFIQLNLLNSSYIKQSFMPKVMKKKYTYFCKYTYIYIPHTHPYVISRECVLVSSHIHAHICTYMHTHYTTHTLNYDKSRRQFFSLVFILDLLSLGLCFNKLILLNILGTKYFEHLSP